MSKPVKKNAHQPDPPPTASRGKISKVGWTCLALTFVGLILRLIYLGKASYQIDEVITIRDAISQAGPWEIYQTELSRFAWYRVLPLFMIPIHWFHEWFASGPGFPSEWITRLPGALAGSLALPLFYLLARSVLGKSAGLIALALVVISPFHLYYTREAYSYGYVMSFSCGLLWCSLLLLQRDWQRDQSLPWKISFGYVAFATLFLHTHMTCAVFLAVWSLVFVAGMLWLHGFKYLGTPRNIGFYAFTLGMPYVCFLPFIIQVLKSGYKSTDINDYTVYFNLDALQALIGRMGWGESAIGLFLFVLVLVIGVRIFGASSSPQTRKTLLLLFLQFVIYVAVQGFYQKISGSRFETRYFSSAFPVLVLLTASGLELIRARLSATTRLRLAGSAVVALPLIWLAMNATLVIGLATRGYNYKGIVNWLAERLPENGVYSFYNVYELRAVPNAYATPGRDATSVAAWSSQEDFDRAQPAERAKSFFTRIPQAVFVEIAPADLLAPQIGQPPIDRDGLFARREWIEDPVADQLFRWRMHPMGEIQWANKSMHRVLISYNLPGDLPEMAKRNGRTTYHEYGSGWRYFNDQGYNHWMAVSEEAAFAIGNVSTQAINATLLIRALAPPPGCRMLIKSSTGSILGSYALNEKGLAEIRIPDQTLAPGKTGYKVAVSQLTRSSQLVPALFYSIEVEHIPLVPLP